MNAQKRKEAVARSKKSNDGGKQRSKRKSSAQKGHSHKGYGEINLNESKRGLGLEYRLWDVFFI